jgi:hypothetical protein
MTKKKVMCILSIFALVVMSCGQRTNNQAETAIEDNHQSEIAENLVYYKERIIIYWRHNDDDFLEYKSEYTEEEWETVQDDDTYYTGSALIYFEEKGEQVVTTKADSIGFIYQQDTVIITKKGIYKYTENNQEYAIGQEAGKGFWDKIILFDGKTKPVIAFPIDVFFDNEEYSWFFKKKEEENAVLLFTERVKTGKEALSEHIRYPLGRGNSIPPVNNRQEFLERYDEIFDGALREKILQSNPSEDWRSMGWRGIMLYDGDVWIDYDGTLVAVNDISALEQKKYDK